MENANGFGDQLRNGFEGFGHYLPNLLFGLVLLGVGWVLAMAVYRGVTQLAYRLGFDRFLSRYGLIATERRSRDGSKTLGAIGGGLVFLLIALQAFRVMKVYAFAAGIQRFFNYLPHVIAAAVILGAALLVGDFVRARLRASAGTGSSYFVAGAVRVGILTLGAFMALQELGIGERIVTLAFGLAFGAIALAAALAFGLGGRSVAEQMSRRWYDQARSNAGTFDATAGREPLRTPRPESRRTEIIDPANRGDDELIH